MHLSMHAELIGASISQSVLRNALLSERFFHTFYIREGRPLARSIDYDKCWVVFRTMLGAGVGSRATTKSYYDVTKGLCTYVTDLCQAHVGSVTS